MTQWYRLAVDVRCGLCGQPLAAGHPVKVLQVPGVKRPKFRGECCEGQAPADVPRKVDPTPFVPRPLPFATFREAVPAIVDAIPFDHKRAAAGKD